MCKLTLSPANPMVEAEIVTLLSRSSDRGLVCMVALCATGEGFNPPARGTSTLFDYAEKAYEYLLSVGIDRDMLYSDTLLTFYRDLQSRVTGPTLSTVKKQYSF